MSSDTTTGSAGIGAEANGASGTRSYGMPPSGPGPANGPANAGPQYAPGAPVSDAVPNGAARHGGTRRKGAPTMGTVAYQQPDSAGAPPGAPQPQQLPQRPQQPSDARPGWSRPSGGLNLPSWARRPGGAVRDAVPGGGRPSQGAPRGRKARLRVARLDPWSVMKTTFVLSIAFAIVSLVASALLWSALNALGVFDSINRTLSSVAPSSQPGSFNVTTILSFGKVMSFTALVSVVNIVLFTALATLAAYLYNMCSSLVGGIEVTLADDTV